MADIKKIKLPRIDEAYNLYDASALHEEDASRFDSAGAAAAVKTEVIGVNGDASSASTIYGAKKYADEKVAGLGAVLNFKGVKNTEADVDAELSAAKVGDVWLCKEDNAEYVCVEDSDGSNKRFEKLGFDVQLSGYVTKGEYDEHSHTVTMVGSNQASNVSASGTIAANTVLTGKTQKHLTISRSTPVSIAAGTTGEALGVNATFNTTVTPATTNIKATATGTALETDDDTIKPVTDVGTPTQVTLPTITDSTWTFTYNNGTLEIGGENGSHTSGSVTAGSAPTLGTDKTFLTSASVKTQPTIALATGATSGAGVISVVNDITGASTTVNTQDKVVAMKTLGTITQPDFTLADTATEGGITFVSDNASSAVNISVSGTADAQTWTQGETTVSTPV